MSVTASAAPQRSRGPRDTQVPAVDDHRGRDLAGRAVLARILAEVDDDRLGATLLVLGRVVGALGGEAERLRRAIPGDGYGNPLPGGEAERRFWCHVHDLGEDFGILLRELLEAAALAEVPPPAHHVVRRPA